MKNILYIIISVAIIITLLAFSVWFNYSKWNDGHCKECGGEWRFVNATHEDYQDYYFYDCEDCGKIIRLSIHP